MTTKNLSPRRQLLAQLASTGKVLCVMDVQNNLSVDKSTALKLLASFVRSGWLKRLGNGLFAIVPMETTSLKDTDENPLLIAQKLFGDSYVGGWSAASFWGFTDQIFLKYWIFTTQRVPKKERTVGRHVYVLTHIAQLTDNTYKEWVENVPVLYGDPHQTVVDFANHIGCFGLNALTDILKAYLRSPHANIARLVQCAGAANNRTVFKRLGFLLERMVPTEKESIQFCQKRISRGYSAICPNLICNQFIRKWNLCIPSSYDF